MTCTIDAAKWKNGRGLMILLMHLRRLEIRLVGGGNWQSCQRVRVTAFSTDRFAVDACRPFVVGPPGPRSGEEFWVGHGEQE
jgi:hypothetical protein